MTANIKTNKRGFAIKNLSDSKTNRFYKKSKTCIIAATNPDKFALVVQKKSTDIKNDKALIVGKDPVVNGQIVEQVNSSIKNDNDLEDLRGFNLFIQENSQYKQAPTKGIVAGVAADQKFAKERLFKQAFFLYGEKNPINDFYHKQATLKMIPLIRWCHYNDPQQPSYLGGKETEAYPDWIKDQQNWPEYQRSWTNDDQSSLYYSRMNQPPKLKPEQAFYQHALMMHKKHSQSKKVLTYQNFEPVFNSQLKADAQKKHSSIKQYINEELWAYQWVVKTWSQDPYWTSKDRVTQVINRNLQDSGVNIFSIEEDCPYSFDPDNKSLVELYNGETVEEIRFSINDYLRDSGHDDYAYFSGDWISKS